jgi:hypothetical protein
VQLPIHPGGVKMKRLLLYLLTIGLGLSPALADTIAVTPGSGATVGVADDGSTNKIPATVITGASSGSTLYNTVTNQAFVNSSGQLGIAGPVTNAGTFAVQSAGSVNVTATNCSGTITTGGTAQNAFTAQTTLHGFTIANIDATTNSGEVLWMSFTTTAAPATTASYPLPSPAATTYTGMGSYTTPPGYGANHAVSIIAATTGHQYSCTWW